MEQNFPRCVREAWDSVEESQAPKTPPISSSEDSSPGPLFFYPKLGHFIWNDQDFNRELSSSPCGLLRQHCWQHGPRAQEHLHGWHRASSPRPDTQDPGTTDAPRGGGSRPGALPTIVLQPPPACLPERGTPATAQNIPQTHPEHRS